VQTITTAATIMQELGILAFLILVGALAFCYMVWRIVKAQDKIADKLNEVATTFSTHHQNALDMHTTCRVHGEQIGYLHKGLNDFKEEITSEINGLSTEVAVLKERVAR